MACKNKFDLFIKIFITLNQSGLYKINKFSIYINDNKYIKLFKDKLFNEYNLSPEEEYKDILIYKNDTNVLYVMNKNYCCSKGRMEFGLYDEEIDEEIREIMIKCMCNLAFPAIPINLKELFNELPKDDWNEHFKDCYIYSEESNEN